MTITPVAAPLVERAADNTLVVSSVTVAEGTDNQHKNVLQLIRTYREDLTEFGSLESQTRNSGSAGGRPAEVFFLNEPQVTLLLTYMRNMDRIRVFKKALVHAFYEMARQLSAPRELSRLELIDMARESELGRLEAEKRAEVSEARVEMIEHTKGFSIREFKKHYFPDVSEGVLNNLLYEKGLLINQRGTKQDKNGNPKDGPQHRHPSYSGNKYFFISWYIDEEKKTRNGSTLVRPGTPETELVEQLERWGLARNKAETQLW